MRSISKERIDILSVILLVNGRHIKLSFNFQKHCSIRERNM